MLAENLFPERYLEFSKLDPKSQNLLVIDDDPDQQLFIAALLLRAGYQVTTARSAIEGLVQMSRVSMDLVISDLKMPDMNGFDFIQEVRNSSFIPKSSYLPIIMLTSCTRDLEFVSLEIGADMFCEKKNAWRFLLGQVEFLLS